VHLSHTLAIKGETQMANKGEYFANNPEIVKIFDDLERFKAFCRTAHLYGHDGYTWNEKDLYNNKSRAWQAYSRFRSGGKRKFNKNNGQGRYQSNRRH
tara:strand:+ start:3478 stop:3771 length:294 start_codon:yes stop_codon:yes gene_type:complete